MREEVLIRPLDTWLGQEFAPSQHRRTIAKILDQATAGIPVEPTAPTRPTIAECDAKLAQYRAAPEAGADPAVVAGWIAETRAERQQAQRHYFVAGGVPQPRATPHLPPQTQTVRAEIDLAAQRWEGLDP
jgi:hypothetical protein